MDEMVEMEVTGRAAGALGVVVETEAGILSEKDGAFARKLLDSYGPLT